MLTFHLLTTDKSLRSRAFSYPLNVYWKHLSEVGIRVKFFYNLRKDIEECDVLGIDSDYFGIQKFIHHENKVMETLQKLNDKIKAIVWFDVTDGSGTLFYPAFSIANVYAKKQLLKDRSLYKKTFFEREHHLDYYYKKFPEELKSIGTLAHIVNQRGLEDWELAKFKLSWNIGLSDIHIFPLKKQLLNYIVPYKWLLHYVEHWKKLSKTIDVSYRVTSSYPFAAASFHRLQITKLLSELMSQNIGHNIVFKGKLKFNDYIRELHDTWIAPSPFGLGEICWRDFECMLCSSLVLKPDMSHLETWPDYYRENETYIPFQWDFSDFMSKLEHLIGDKPLCLHIGKQGRDFFLSTHKQKTGKQFALRLKDILECAMKN